MKPSYIYTLSHVSPCITSKWGLRKIQPAHSVHYMIKFYGISCVNFCKEKINSLILFHQLHVFPKLHFSI